jgi:hypothetical protein
VEKWSIPTLKVAAKQDPLFTSHSTTRIDSVIDDFMQGKTEEQTKALSIRDMIRNELRSRLLEPPAALAHFGVGTNLSSSLTEEEMQKYGTCAQCSIS